MLLRVLIAALIYQVTIVGSYLLIFHALDAHVSIAGAFAFIPAVSMLQALPISLGGRGRRPGFGLGDPEAGVLQFPGDPVGVGDRQRPLDFGGQPAEVDGQGLQGGGDLRRRPARRAGPVGRTGPPRANGATGEPRTRR